MHSKPKKSLGQNFLVDKNIRDKIVSACSFSSADTLLEVGPGRGELTVLFASMVKELYAVEIDERLYGHLSKQLSVFPNCRLVKADILKVDLNSFLSKEGVRQKIKVFGNIPYYISSPLIEYFISYRTLISEVFITVQKEYAQRLTAAPGSKSYGSLSCFAQYYLEPELLFNIKKNSFLPVPKVDSSFLKLKVRSSAPCAPGDEELFFRIIRGAFNKRRKTLRNSLEGIIPGQSLDAFFKASGMDRNIRPEQLGLADFASLTKFVKKS
jgi:16S rRNA (adenine1518-N6/adenine1519-N6)-dimethyltransferase